MKMFGTHSNRLSVPRRYSLRLPSFSALLVSPAVTIRLPPPDGDVFPNTNPPPYSSSPPSFSVSSVLSVVVHSSFPVVVPIPFPVPVPPVVIPNH